MAKARISNRHRVGDQTFEVVNFTEKGEFILRDQNDGIRVFEASEDEWVELQCERCGVFSMEAGPVDHPTCFSSDSDAACLEMAGLRGDEEA